VASTYRSCIVLDSPPRLELSTLNLDGFIHLDTLQFRRLGTHGAGGLYSAGAPEPVERSTVDIRRRHVLNELAHAGAAQVAGVRRQRARLAQHIMDSSSLEDLLQPTTGMLAYLWESAR
jgi:hypothetical protein